jgi:hypothetical protein
MRPPGREDREERAVSSYGDINLPPRDCALDQRVEIWGDSVGRLFEFGEGPAIVDAEVVDARTQQASINFALASNAALSAEMALRIERRSA